MAGRWIARLRNGGYNGRMRFRTASCAALAAVLICAAPAAAEPVLDRVQVGVPGKDSPTRGFAENLSIAMKAPSAYERGCCADFVSGAWDGPRIEASDSSALQNRSRIEWSATFERSRATEKRLARAAGWADYPEIEAKRRRVRHIVAGRRVGFLPAFTAIDAQESPGAKVQAAVAIGFGRRVHGTVLFHLPDPAADQSSAGTLTVEGQPASTWNRAQARNALAGVYVEGSLPPARVNARRAGSRVKGTVRDSFGHPVSGAEVTLERRAGGGWRKAGTGTSSGRGAFNLSAVRSGAYRVVAALAGTRARAAVRAG
jgi:Carboxypeptidase regulatory-like domain